jgi:hypothetical protein
MGEDILCGVRNAVERGYLVEASLEATFTAGTIVTQNLEN